MTPLQAFLKEHFFDSWGQLLRCTRDEQRNTAEKAIREAIPARRFAVFQALAYRLSGSECAYLIWTFNLMDYDPSRETGWECGEKGKVPADSAS